MYSLDKYPSRAGRIGRALPSPFPVLGNAGIKFRHGAESMIAGRPGSFKSIFAMNLVYHWYQESTILYFAADSDEYTEAMRMATILTGDNADKVESAFKANKDARYVKSLKAMSNVRFVYRQMDMDGIANQVASFAEVYGDYPDVVILDNLIDFVDRPDDWGGMLLLTKEMKGLSLETKSHVCILHHARIDKDSDNGMPPNDWEIQGKVTQIPSTVLTVGARNLGTYSRISMSCEKNRIGPQKTGHMDFEVAPNLRITDVTSKLIGEMQ